MYAAKARSIDDAAIDSCKASFYRGGVELCVSVAFKFLGVSDVYHITFVAGELVNL
jgi:hypothetical protein